MKNKENTQEEVQCLSCLGAGVIYDDIMDNVKECTFCNGTGQSTVMDNESFLESINYN